MTEKILIVGSSSKVAQTISETLTNNDYELIGTFNREYPQNPECYKELIKINFSDLKQLNKLKELRGISNVVFTIGMAEFLDEEISNVNYYSLKNLIDYLKKIKRGVRIIFCSSSSVYGNNNSKIINEKSKKEPSNFYGKYKLKAEDILINSEIKHIILRFPLIFGSYFKQKFRRFIEAIKNNKGVIFGNGNNCFSFVHQSDLSDFVLKIIRNNNLTNEDFNIASGFTSQKDYICSVSKIFNKEKVKMDPLEDLFKIAENQLKKYKKFGLRPSLYKEDVISLSRNRKYDINKSLKLLKWKPRYNIDKSIKDTFLQNRLLSRWNGIKILKYLYPDRLLPVKIYRNPQDFNPKDFQKNSEDIWSITIRDEEGDLINTDHLFSRDDKNIKKFMIKNKKLNKVYIVRLSPPRGDILYYGSFLMDKNNFKNKVMITISKNPEEPFVTRKEGKSLRLLPRDFVPDYNLIYENKKLKGNFPKRHSNVIVSDIVKLINLMKKTKREDLTIPVLFIISKRGVQYISLGL